jgi:hypothetical protein
MLSTTFCEDLVIEVLFSPNLRELAVETLDNPKGTDSAESGGGSIVLTCNVPGYWVRASRRHKPTASASIASQCLPLPDHAHQEPPAGLVSPSRAIC